MRAPDGWDSARFWAFSELWQIPTSKPVSPQPPVTRAVGQCLAKAKSALFGSFDPRPKIVCKKHKDKE
jgi:hypothetical protein